MQHNSNSQKQVSGKTIDRLCRKALLSPEKIGYSYKAANLFPMRVPDHFVDKISPNDLDDPLLKQILPVDDELTITHGYSDDPLNELEYQPVPGVLHKYHGRVLIITTGSCAIHCRYCFRRHFDYEASAITENQLHHIINYIINDSSVFEVILSGGDPLMLSDERLDRLTKEISRIPHIKYLRIHTRIPVVSPARILKSSLPWLNNRNVKHIIVVHVNHPDELDSTVHESINKIKITGTQLFNQAVLLHGINDSSDILINLSKKLFDYGILPYYIHLLDPVSGSAHFQVSQEKASRLINDIRNTLPGYLVPKMVKEIPGMKHKIPIELIHI